MHRKLSGDETCCNGHRCFIVTVTVTVTVTIIITIITVTVIVITTVTDVSPAEHELSGPGLRVGIRTRSPGGSSAVAGPRAPAQHASRSALPLVFVVGFSDLPGDAAFWGSVLRGAPRDGLTPRPPHRAKAAMGAAVRGAFPRPRGACR